MRRMMIWVWVLVGMLSAAVTFSAEGVDLKQGFAAPPIGARPRVYWYWMNGNLSKDGVTRDLEAMKRAGLGGAMLMEVTCGIPEGKVRTGSPEWWDLVRHVLKEADRLGLEITFGNGTGWSGSQGPWVKPEDAMQQVVSSETRVKGPVHFKGSLAQPYTKAGFYRDISVFAIPAVRGDMTAMKPKISSDPTGTKVRIADLHDSSINDLPPLATDVDVLADGDPDTALRLPARTAGEPVTFTLEYPAPYTARSLTIVPGFYQGYEGELQSSDDGVHYRKIRAISIPNQGPVTRGVQTMTLEPVTARWFRVVLGKVSSPMHGRVELGELTLGGGARAEGWEAMSGLLAARNGVPTPPLQPADMVNPATMVDLSSRFSADGRLEWDAPAGDWVVVRMGHTTYSSPYDTPPKWAQGLETDKLSREALAHHWASYMGKVVDLAGPSAGKALFATHTDSWECGSQNWTPRFREEFKKRRGYELTPWLPALTGRVVGSVQQTERFFWDMRRTIADLIADNYFGGLADLAHRNGLLFTTEAYGNAAMDSFQCAGRGDIPMTEVWTSEWKRKPEEDWYLKWGSSPAHVYGRRRVGAESFTTSPDKAHGLGGYMDHPYSVKAIGDNHMFCGGVNLMTIHVFAHQPWAEAAPGMTVGEYGWDFNRGQTWWAQARSWTDYLSRSSFMLQQGLFVADALYFYGEEPKGNGSAARVSLSPVVPRGYDYDLCPAEVLMHRLQVKDKRIVLPDGMSYRYLVVNHGEPMTLPVVERIRELVAAGATLVGPRPQVKSPGLSGYPGCDTQIQKIIADVWGDCDGVKVKEHAFGSGRVLWSNSLSEIFDRDGLVPDFAYQAPAKMDLNYIHRRTAAADIYFVANLQYQPVQSELRFRVSGRQPEFWHPDTGKIEPVPVWREEGGLTHIPFTFDPAGSVFVVFRAGKKPAAHLTALGMEDGATSTTAQAHVRGGQVMLDVWKPGTVRCTKADGKVAAVEVKSVPQPLELTGPWQLHFPLRGKPALDVTFDSLVSWPQRPEADIRYFSGTATYVHEFTAPPQMLGRSRRVDLDLGQVAIMAELKLNGQELGVLWKPPFRVDVTGALKPGKNRLEVKVVNQWANRLIGDEQLPDDCEWNGAVLKTWPEWLVKGTPRPSKRTTFTTFKHWSKTDRLLDSGLLGPVVVRAGESVRVP